MIHSICFKANWWELKWKRDEWCSHLSSDFSGFHVFLWNVLDYLSGWIWLRDAAVSVFNVYHQKFDKVRLAVHLSTSPSLNPWRLLRILCLHSFFLLNTLDFAAANCGLPLNPQEILTPLSLSLLDKLLSLCGEIITVHTLLLCSLVQFSCSRKRPLSPTELFSPSFPFLFYWNLCVPLHISLMTETSENDWVSIEV